jgi:hypothetical protein
LRQLAHALQGVSPGSRRCDYARAPGEWERVVSAVEEALLAGRLEAPPAHLQARLARALGSAPPAAGPAHDADRHAQ